MYGESENIEQKQNLYIYGIGLKPKMEQTYFKEYYPLGFLKVRNEEMFWISLKGQEEKIKGFFVFYAPNQAMQEYLVDNHKEEKDKPEVKVKRQLQEEPLPMKEKLVFYKKADGLRKSKKASGSKFVFSVGGVLAAAFIVMALMTTSGQKKLDIFKRIIQETMSNAIVETEKQEFIIEETEAEEIINPQKLEQNKNEEEFLQHLYEENQKVEKIEEISSTENTQESLTSKNEPEISQTESLEEKETAESQTVQEKYEEYIVQEGDTLVGICKKKYGTPLKMQEICTVNNIRNADYIAPGQKLYLP